MTLGKPGATFYTPESIYHVHDVRLTLPEYQTAMNATLRTNDIQLVQFRNIITNDDWVAIFYDISTTNRETGETTSGNVMEFVNFKDYGEGMGTRVVEGWAGTKGEDYDGLMKLLTSEEKAAQEAAIAEIANHEIPEIDVLSVRYPVLHPTAIRTALGREIRQVLLMDFESWNKGFKEWSEWMSRYVTEDFVCHTDFGDATAEQYRDAANEWFEGKHSKRVYFDNLMVRDNWAAIRYKVVSTVGEEKEVKSQGE